MNSEEPGQSAETKPTVSAKKKDECDGSKPKDISHSKEEMYTLHWPTGRIFLKELLNELKYKWIKKEMDFFSYKNIHYQSEVNKSKEENILD